MKSGKIRNYWFSTGTSTFLIKQLKENRFYNLENEIATELTFGSFQLGNIDGFTLFFQTGYLTIREKIALDSYQLDYPNQEVKNALLQLLLAEFRETQVSKSQPLILKIK